MTEPTKQMKFPLEIGDFVTVCSNGNTDHFAQQVVLKIIGETIFYERKAYVCSSGTLLVSLNFKEDGLYVDARLGNKGSWYAVADEHTLSIQMAIYKRKIVEGSRLTDEQIDQVYTILKDFHSKNGLSARSFIF